MYREHVMFGRPLKCTERKGLVTLQFKPNSETGIRAVSNELELQSCLGGGAKRFVMYEV